ncbi:MAG: putative manganese-dependent inorganic diphosphatase [Chloroflexales bacterium]|nr:putative manganese-dependent inorganic diphosphatase [Chloroflexales bacterium]
MDTVLVIGHRNPDTDSICSALAYAHLYHHHTGRDTVACYVDDLAPETIWLLNHLGLQPPMPVNDVYLRVSDVMETEPPTLRPNQTLREAGLLMQQAEMRALPVVNYGRRLVGLVERDALASHYLDQIQLPEKIDLPVSLLLRMLGAELLAGSSSAIFRNHIWIATMTAATVRATVAAGEGVIVGDQPEVQQAALEVNAGCLILTDGAPMAESLLVEAGRRGTIVFRTNHSPFAAALLMQQSIPVDRVMTHAITAVTVRPDTPLGEAKDQLRKQNLAALAVVDEHGRLVGLLRRRVLAEQHSRRVILTDHNHPEQAAPGVTESQILAIVDHHNLGGLQTLQPLAIHCDTVGSTCTLIAELYRQSEAPLPAPIAGAMLGAILSDTVQFRSPTTTERDRVIAAWLEERSGEMIDVLARRMFRARLPDPIPPAAWWAARDRKIFSFGSLRFSISQVELTDVAEVMPSPNELSQALQAGVSSDGLDTAFILLTDILDQSSLLIAANAQGEDLARRAFAGTITERGMLLPGVMSRKKQVLPPLAAVLMG